MYRYMIEHPDWLPPEGKSELLPHYRLGDDRGRIYRVVPSMQKVAPIQNLEKLSSVELIKAFDTSNDFVRDKIHQIILWRNDKKTVPGFATDLEDRGIPCGSHAGSLRPARA